MENVRLVVEDPNGRYAEGEVVLGNDALQLIATKQAAILPIEPELLEITGTSGWAKRAWGRGHAFDPVTPKWGCRMALYIVPNAQFLHWVAKVVLDDPEKQPAGMLRFLPDTGQRGAVAVGATEESPVVSLADIQFRGAGRAYIEGKLRMGSPIEGFLGLGLYGVARGARIAWVAASQTR